jgi:hypothetical protein
MPLSLGGKKIGRYCRTCPAWRQALSIGCRLSKLPGEGHRRGHRWQLAHAFHPAQRVGRRRSVRGSPRERGPGRMGRISYGAWPKSDPATKAARSLTAPNGDGYNPQRRDVNRGLRSTVERKCIPATTTRTEVCREDIACVVRTLLGLALTREDAETYQQLILWLNETLALLEMADRRYQEGEPTQGNPPL